MYDARMPADFARWYLWARGLEERHPANQDIRLLVLLLRQLDDLRIRAAETPDLLPHNLASPMQEAVYLLVERLAAAYPAEPPP